MGSGADEFVSDSFRNSTVIGGPGRDKFTFASEFAGSTLDAGANDDTANFGVVNSLGGRNPLINMGNGDDVLVFGGNVSGSTPSPLTPTPVKGAVNLGNGSDQATFRANVSNTVLNLGGDNNQDTVYLTRGKRYWQGFQITGADTSDRLIIGTAGRPNSQVTYQYVSGNVWANVNNPNDTIRF